jgi:pimeloyl-ACP methyl ester carboxylesterase
LAARHPDRVTRLILVGPTVDRNARSLGRQAGRLGGVDEQLLRVRLAHDSRQLGGDGGAEPTLAANPLRMRAMTFGFSPRSAAAIGLSGSEMPRL